MQEAVGSEEVTLKLCNTSVTSFDPTVLLEVLPAVGLTEDCRKYLEESVLEFCRPEHQQALKSAFY